LPCPSCSSCRPWNDSSLAQSLAFHSACVARNPTPVMSRSYFGRRRNAMHITQSFFIRPTAILLATPASRWLDSSPEMEKDGGVRGDRAIAASPRSDYADKRILQSTFEERICTRQGVKS
jgi:hypothetical protein